MRASETQIADTSVSFLNLLVDNEARMKYHAQNLELVVYVTATATNPWKNFPIYNKEMRNNLMNAYADLIDPEMV